MRIIVAPDKFKGSLPATQVADGGEGFLRVLPEPQLADLLRTAGLPAAEAARRAETRAGLDGLPTAVLELLRL